ncbi:DUF1993 domain-containing protein [Pseudomonas sp. N040]|uniref:DUF1993 domain-containing protein n=1 Tax=Pseudomonas sp. N040 TaxID=2785325 RepID=UPI0018A2550C|nr:DUF1993 domain-containing protein [Pseudomonas sp. N040]MBF7729262.1 DUF1993 domain-containing protein [Pseudomonas sp. N040]MBW7012902.1 DUF1993 domain-containing protein [Pseudomonas sp. N040]
MSLTMYQASVPQFLRMLGNLASILEKAESWAAEKKIDPAVLLNMRLAPDMFPLKRQLQIATDSAKGCAARLAGVAIPSYPDTEETFAELKARLQKTIDFLASFTPAQIDGSEDKAIVLNFPSMELKFSGRDYLFQFVQPNFYFHLTTAYAILRHNGLDIGKMDFIGRPA